MHTIAIAEEVKERVRARVGREHPFDRIDPAKTALVVVDMQNYFVKPGYMGEVPLAREIVPAINRMAAGLRDAGGHVIWIKNSTNDTRESWSMFHDHLMSPDKAALRYETMDEAHEGHALWDALDVREQDAQIVKKRFSAFLQGSSTIVDHLRGRGVDTVIIVGTATNICCESSARDAMMLNFKTIMLSDATATFTDAEHNASLTVFYSLFGDVQTVGECLGFLRGQDAARAAA